MLANHRIRIVFALCTLGLLALLLAACTESADAPTHDTPAAETPDGQTPAAVTPTAGDAAAFSISSDSFAEGEPIPAVHTCDGDNTSPPLAWSSPPTGTNAFALIVDDADAPGGVFTHWVLFNLPGAATELPEDVPATEQLDTGGSQGLNDAGSVGYTGPCPPAGPAHLYTFTIFALDREIAPGTGAVKSDIVDAMEGFVLGVARLTGTYGR